MKTHAFRAGAVLGAAALLATALVSTAAPAQADDPGTIVVTVVDQYGRPVTGVVSALNEADQDQQAETGGTVQHPFVVGTQHTWTVDPGGYEFISITPWTGIECYGLTPCSITGDLAPDPVVTVTSGQVSTYTIVVHVPTITGTAAVGSPLTVQIPQGITTLLNALPTPPGGHGITQQWLRGGSEIAGATSTSYAAVPADSGTATSARLDPSSVQSAMTQGYGIPVTPFVTNSATQATFVPVKTKTKFKVPHHLRDGDRISLKVNVKAVDHGVPDGQVTIKIGHSTVRKTLTAGSTFANLPPFKAGTYKITVTYSGSVYFAKSKKKLRITVKP